MILVLVCPVLLQSHFYEAGKPLSSTLRSSTGCKLQLTAASEFLSMFYYIQLFFIVATTLLAVRFICKASLFLSKPHIVNYSYHFTHI